MRTWIDKLEERRERRVKLANLQVEEVSAVDNPAHGMNGWLVIKSRDGGDMDGVKYPAEMQRWLDEGTTGEEFRAFVKGVEEELRAVYEELVDAKKRAEVLRLPEGTEVTYKGATWTIGRDGLIKRSGVSKAKGGARFDTGVAKRAAAGSLPNTFATDRLGNFGAAIDRVAKKRGIK